MFVPGKAFTLVALLFSCAAILYYISTAKRGRIPVLRRIPGLDAIEEGIGRSTEIGRPVFYTPGRGSLTSSSAAQTLAGLEILTSVARSTARYKTDIVVAIAEPNVYPLAEEITKGAYSAVGCPELYRSEMVRFLSSEQFAFTAACMGIMHREKVGTAIMMGDFQAESLMLAEAASQVGAITVGGCSRLVQIPFFVAACDYTLIGEELYVGGAYLSRDPVKLGSIAGQDIPKIAAVILILLGALLKTFGSNFLTKLLTL